MRVPISWLREYVDLPAESQAIADRLASLGFPVETIESRPHISGVVVGKITAMEKHPNADRLQVCSVDTGGDEPLTIATAATNVAVGQVIPVAIIGAQLPHIKIERRKMRGVESQGMMCSADELALTPEWFEDGIMQLDADTPLGADVVELFGLADDVLEVEVTSNRVDAMAVLGLARELAASFESPLRLPSFENPGRDDEPANAAPRVTIDTTACTRFVAQLFDGVKVAPAPAWMRIRLALAGQRPINNLVDISNYVMFEVGEPLHFYDADRVTSHHLIVRDARDNETLTTLDGEKHELQPQFVAIADEQEVLGLAGLMGGASSEVRDETTSIILEAANFEGARIRRASMQLAFRTEASSRHEKNLAPALSDMGAARAAQLLVRIGAHAYRPHAFGETLTAQAPIVLRAQDVERLLGLPLEPARIASHLERLGCAVHRDGAKMTVTPPAWRRDLAIAADLIEEVARVEGYDNIEPIEPAVPAHEISSGQYLLENRVADTLQGLRYHEVLTYSLHGAQLFEKIKRAGITPSHASVEVRNPLSEDQRYLRYALGPNLIEYFARAGQPCRIFEIGHVFYNENGHIAEMPMIAFGFTTEPANDPAWHDSNFLRLKGDCEALIRAVCGIEVKAAPDTRTGLHPGKTAVLLHEGREIAALGKVDPRVAKSFDVRFPAYLCNIYLDSLPEYRTPSYHPPSKYPSTYRDLAMVVALDVTAENISAIAQNAIGELCRNVRVFDEYRGPQVGEGKKSLAVRIVMQRYDATITDAEADEAIARALAALREEAGATIRE